MIDKNNLTEGNIFKSLVKLALPIIGTSFVQMAYNMTDMAWLGRVDLEGRAVAASGTAGFFTWFGMAFILLARIGVEVKVSHTVGKKDIKTAKKYASTAIQIILLLAIFYSFILLVFRNQLIGFFRLEDTNVAKMAVDYLSIIALGLIFYFLNPIFTAIFNGSGDSKTPFIMNCIGLVSNIILDPILIFGVGIIPALGVKGAAIATIFSQFIVTMSFILVGIKKSIILHNIEIFKRLDFEYVKSIIRIGIPTSIQSAFFTVIAMLIARVIAQWGETAIAVQKVGSQIEAISWMTAGGFQTALSAFIGQNYGAKKWDRIYKGYFAGLLIVMFVGVFSTCLLYFGAKPVFSVFIPGEKAIEMGIVYLKILAISQIFMCIEIATAGAFNGLGKTTVPAVVSIIFTGLRYPGAVILSAPSILGLNGVWWSISISSIFKGSILLGLFFIVLLRHPDIGKDKIVKMIKVKSNNI